MNSHKGGENRVKDRPRPRVGTYRLVALLVATGLLSASFQMLLPVVPIVLESRGPYGIAGAGTATVFVGMVIAELATPWLLSTIRPVTLLVFGAILTAVPSLLIALPVDSFVVLGAVAARGVGMGINVVVGVAMVMEHATPNRRGRSIGYIGLANGIPGIVFPPIGVALADAGLAPAAVIASFFISMLAASVASLLWHEPRSESPSLAPLSSIRRPGIIRLVVALALVSSTYGGLLTYAPVVLPTSGLNSAAVFFLIVGCTRAAGRWAAGTLGDHYSVHIIVALSLVLAAGGLVALSDTSPGRIVFGAVAFGLGSGAIQSCTYLLMASKTLPAEWNTVSALWNASIDVGSAFGGGLMGLTASRYGFAAGLWEGPIAIAAAVIFIYAWRPKAAQV